MDVIDSLKKIFFGSSVHYPNQKRLKCRNCGHNISMRSGRWFHKNIEHDKGPNDGGYYVFRISCGYTGCRCQEPFPKRHGQKSKGDVKAQKRRWKARQKTKP